MMNIMWYVFYIGLVVADSAAVEMYTNWYMMWYLKKDMFCKEHIFSD